MTLAEFWDLEDSALLRTLFPGVLDPERRALAEGRGYM